MSRPTVGYFEGTDPQLLTGLICLGFDTIPVSNGFDNHGRHIRGVHEGNRFALLVGYLHKVYAPKHAAPSYQDIFHVCRVYEMPLLLEVPRELHEKTGRLIGGPPPFVTLADPEDALDKAREILGV